MAEIPVALKGPLHARIDPGRSIWADGALDVGGGAIDLAVSIDETTTDATLTVGALPLSLLEPWFSGLGAPGQVDASLQVDGPPTATRGTLTVDARNLTVEAAPAEIETPPVAVSLTGGWEGGALSAEVRVEGLPGTIAAATAKMPFALSVMPFDAVISEQASIDATLRAEGDLAQLSLILPLGEDRLRGALDAEVVAAGTLGAPTMTGRATITGGRYENFDADAIIDALELALVFDGRTARIERLTATDGEAGRLEGNGTLAFDGNEASRLEVSLEQFFLLRRDEVTAPFSGTITTEFDAAGLAVGGGARLAADRGDDSRAFARKHDRAGCHGDQRAGRRRVIASVRGAG
jgi:translocation and assembly module TamB